MPWAVVDGIERSDVTIGDRHRAGVWSSDELGVRY